MRNTTVRTLHDVGTVFTALCVVHSRAVSSRGLRRVLGRVSSSPLCGAASLLCAAAVCCVHVARFRASAVAGTSGTDHSGRDFLEGRRHRGVARVGRRLGRLSVGTRSRTTLGAMLNGHGFLLLGDQGARFH